MTRAARAKTLVNPPLGGGPLGAKKATREGYVQADLAPLRYLGATVVATTRLTVRAHAVGLGATVAEVQVEGVARNAHVLGRGPLVPVVADVVLVETPIEPSGAVVLVTLVETLHRKVS